MEDIDTMIREEMKAASNFATLATVKMRVLHKVAGRMGIALRNYDVKDCTRVDPSIARAFELLWNGGPLIGEHFQTHVVDKTEDYAVLERFLAKDFTKPIDIVRLSTALQKRYPSSPLRRVLWYLFAVDGLGGSIDRFECYFENLSVPLVLGDRFENEIEDEDWKTAHVRAVRTVYRDVRCATPDRLAATLNRLFGLKNASSRAQKVRGDGSSVPSSESSSESEDEEEKNEDESFDRFIADLYKRLVGNKILSIAARIRERRGDCIIKDMSEESQQSQPSPVVEEKKKEEKVEEKKVSQEEEPPVKKIKKSDEKKKSKTEDKTVKKSKDATKIKKSKAAKKDVVKVKKSSKPKEEPIEPEVTNETEGDGINKITE